MHIFRKKNLIQPAHIWLVCILSLTATLPLQAQQYCEGIWGYKDAFTEKTKDIYQGSTYKGYIKASLTVTFRPVQIQNSPNEYTHQWEYNIVPDWTDSRIAYAKINQIVRNIEIEEVNIGFNNVDGGGTSFVPSPNNQIPKGSGTLTVDQAKNGNGTNVRSSTSKATIFTNQVNASVDFYDSGGNIIGNIGLDRGANAGNNGNGGITMWAEPSLIDYSTNPLKPQTGGNVCSNPQIKQYVNGYIRSFRSTATQVPQGQRTTFYWDIDPQSNCDAAGGNALAPKSIRIVRGGFDDVSGNLPIVYNGSTYSGSFPLPSNKPINGSSYYTLIVEFENNVYSTYTFSIIALPVGTPAPVPVAYVCNGIGTASVTKSTTSGSGTYQATLQNTVSIEEIVPTDSDPFGNVNYFFKAGINPTSTDPGVTNCTANISYTITKNRVIQASGPITLNNIPLNQNTVYNIPGPPGVIPFNDDTSYPINDPRRPVWQCEVTVTMLDFRTSSGGVPASLRLPTESEGVLTVCSKTPPPPIPNPPVIKNFNAPATVVLGSSAVLNWEVDGADNVYISEGVNKVNKVSVDKIFGSRTVMPYQPTIYNLEATNTNGTVIMSKTVSVSNQNPVFSTAIPSGTYQGVGTLTLQDAASVSSGNNVVLESTQTISLRPGTILSNGSTVSLRINPAITPSARQAEAFQTKYTPDATFYEEQNRIETAFAETVGLVSYPNPFSQSTTLAYALPEGGHVNLSVYNLVGKQVAQLVDGYREAGKQEVVFEAKDLPAGAYFCLLKTPGQSLRCKLVLVR
jgi:hypothetical protein